MIRFPVWCASRSFCIGMALGLMVNLALWAPCAQGRAAVSSQPPVCTNPPPGLTQEEIAFFQVQCAVHQAVFADASEPSSAYRFEEAFSKLGSYDGQNHAGRAVRFDATWVLPLDLKTHAPHLWALGVEVYAAAGTLAGPAGKIAVAGAQVFTNGWTPDSGYAFIVAQTLTPGELDDFSTSSRILAGVRVVDISTGQSTPLDDLTGTPSLWALGGDPGTLYCGCAPDSPGNRVDPACVRRAYDTYKNCVKTAEELAGVCLIAATVYFAACIAHCVIVGPLSVGCSLICLARYVAAMAACMAALAVRLNSCKRQLKIELRACGAVIYED